MKIQDLERERKIFDRTFAVDYPPPTPKADDTEKQSNVLLWAWGIVSIAGAIISFPHTMKAISQSVPEIQGALSFLYAGAVFIGVELALLIVAFTEAYRHLENPKPRAVLTLKTVIASILYRLGLASKPNPETTSDTNMSGLLIGLVISAILFNLADTTQSEQLKSIIKFVSGLLAPMLLFMAGHEFANQVATRLLASKIAKRNAEQVMIEWEQGRNEAWREHAKTITAKKGSDVKPVPLANTVPNSLNEWNGVGMVEAVNGRMNKPVNGNGGDVNTAYLMSPTE